MSLPHEMGRHHSFVFDSSRIIRSAIFKLHNTVEQSEKLIKRVDSMFHAVHHCNDLVCEVSDASKHIKELSNDLPALLKASVKECHHAVESVRSVKSEVVHWFEHAKRLMAELYYNKTVLRDGADEILRNLNAYQSENIAYREIVDSAAYLVINESK